MEEEKRVECEEMMRKSMEEKKHVEYEKARKEQNIQHKKEEEMRKSMQEEEEKHLEVASRAMRERISHHKKVQSEDDMMSKYIDMQEDKDEDSGDNEDYCGDNEEDMEKETPEEIADLPPPSPGTDLDLLPPPPPKDLDLSPPLSPPLQGAAIAQSTITKRGPTTGMASAPVPDIARRSTKANTIEKITKPKTQIRTLAESRGYEQLILKQQFTGSWDVKSVTEEIKISPEQMLKAKPDSIGDDLWATLCAVAFLEIVFPSSKVVWSMVTRKACVFVTKEFSLVMDYFDAETKTEDFVELAKNFLNQLF